MVFESLWWVAAWWREDLILRAVEPFEEWGWRRETDTFKWKENGGGTNPLAVCTWYGTMLHETTQNQWYCSKAVFCCWNEFEMSFGGTFISSWGWQWCYTYDGQWSFKVENHLDERARGGWGGTRLQQNDIFSCAGNTTRRYNFFLKENILLA